MRLTTLRELFYYNDWANGKLLDAAAALSSDALDRPHEMGPGSLRHTLLHTLHGETMWRLRASGAGETPWPSEPGPVDVSAMRERYQENAAARDAFLTTVADVDLPRVQRYRDSRGSRYLASLGDMLLQAIVHSHHHRAQALVMVRRSGGALPRPGLDYIFMRREITDRPVACDHATVAALLRYGDRMQHIIFAAMAGLPDEALDRDMDMGPGTLRKTLSHIWVTEHWWLHHWRGGDPTYYPSSDTGLSPEALQRQYDETARGRDEFLKTVAGDGWTRELHVESMPRVKRVFSLGVVALQTGLHGVHHRAQAVNMLRRLGGPTLEMDYMYSVRQAAE